MNQPHNLNLAQTNTKLLHSLKIQILIEHVLSNYSSNGVVQGETWRWYLSFRIRHYILPRFHIISNAHNTYIMGVCEHNKIFSCSCKNLVGDFTMSSIYDIEDIFKF